MKEMHLSLSVRPVQLQNVLQHVVPQVPQCTDHVLVFGTIAQPLCGQSSSIGVHSFRRRLQRFLIGRDVVIVALQALDVPEKQIEELEELFGKY
jgi:hypothetical protein